MNAQQLKNAILQEAIEGRLVPQDPNDEPASVLLARIRKEKERLVKEGKLKKKDLEVKPISEDEIPFEIPESWEWVRIKSIFSMQAGKNVTSADISDEQNDTFKYPCYGGNGLRGFVKGYNTEGVYPLVGRQGALCGNINIANGRFWATEHAVVTDGYGMTPYKWQYFFLTALNLNQYATATAQPGLAVSNVIEILIPLPPLVEQHRIVAKIEELLPKVEEYGKAQDALNKLNAELPERLKKSILQEAIEGRLVPQDPNDEPASVLLDKIRQEKAQLVKAGKLKKKDLIETPITEDEIPFEIPESWKWCRLCNIGEIVTGGTPPKHELKYYGNDYPFFKPADLDQGINTKKSIDSLSVKGFEYSRKLPKDSVLVTCIGSIGKTGLIRKEGTCNQQINAVIPSKHIIIPEFLYHVCLSSFFQESMWNSSSSTTLAILNKNKFSQLLIPLPPLAEQKRIVAKIEDLLKEIDKL